MINVHFGAADARASSLDKLADDTLRVAEARLLAHDDVSALLVAFRDGAVQVALPLAWSDTRDRARKLERIRQVFEALRIDRYSAVVRETAPAEALHVLAADRDGRVALRSGVIERDDAGKPIGLLPQSSASVASPIDDLVDLARPPDPVAFWYVPH